MDTKRETGSLPENIEFELNNQKLKIEKKIDQGATAEIYSGTLTNALDETAHVALKVLNPWGFEFSKKDFEIEMESLRYLMDYEDEINKKTGTDIHVAPYYYGRASYEDANFFCMEFVEGEKIPSILVKKNQMIESQSLVIAWQLFRTLHLMHTKLKRAYIDFKFDNLWWVKNDSVWKGQLKITDLGSLEMIKGDLRKVKRDILTAAVYVFKIMTGSDLAYSRRNLKERAEPLIKKQTISWGAKKNALEITTPQPWRPFD